jgi:hypothetical protein
MSLSKPAMDSLVLLKLTGDDTQKLRGMQAPNKYNVYSVYDFITKVCKYGNSGATARNEFKRLIKDGSEFKDEVVALCYYLKFPGAGQRDTPCMTIKGASAAAHDPWGQGCSRVLRIGGGCFHPSYGGRPIAH